MRKAKSLVGLKIITKASGQDLGVVRDLIFSENSQRLVALLLTDRELFGVIDATCIRWESVQEIGTNAIMIGSDEEIVKVHSDSLIAEGYDAQFTLDGKQVTTDSGENLGKISDLYLDSNGYINGYEISGGLFADAFSGKRFLAAPSYVTMGQDVVIVPHDVTVQIQRDAETNPGGVAGVASGVGASVAGAYDSAKSKVVESYENIAGASVEKQREYVIGKIAGHDVTTGGDAPEMLVSAGGLISPEIADRAITHNVLGSLVIAATQGSVVGSAEVGSAESSQNALDGAQKKTDGVLASAHQKAEEAAIGKPSAREIAASDGSILVAPGMIVTREILERADSYGKKNEVVAAAGMGAASETAQKTYADAKEAATSVWETIKEKTAEFTGTASEKKAEYDQASLEKRIKEALGRPVTRVILAPDDSVILNTGDIITHKAIEEARGSEALDILLDSVYTQTPELSPESLRVKQHGDAALPSQGEVEPILDRS